MSDAAPAESKFSNGYQPKKQGIGFIRAIVYAIVTILAIYVLLPFTQMLTGDGKDVLEYREFDISPPPPPSPPDMEEPPEPEEQEEPPPDLQEPPPPLDLAQLEMAMNQAAGLGFGSLEAQPDALADLELFDVKDLDERPNPIKRVNIIPPIQFKKERRSGMIRLEVMIDEKGATTVLEIVESSDPALEAPAIEAAEQWIWTAPKKNGEPVKARYIFPIGFRF